MGIEDQEDLGEVIVIFVLILFFYLIFRIVSTYDFNTEKNERIRGLNQNSQIPSPLLAQTLPWYPKGCECDCCVSEVRAWGLHSKPAQVQSSVFPLADLNLIGLGLLDRLQTGLPCESLRDRGRRPVQQFSVRNNSCPGHLGAFLVVQVVNHLPAMQQTWVRSLGWEDPLEKAMATLVLLPGKFHGRRSLVGYSPWGRQGHD